MINPNINGIIPNSHVEQQVEETTQDKYANYKQTNKTIERTQKHADADLMASNRLMHDIENEKYDTDEQLNMLCIKVVEDGVNCIEKNEKVVATVSGVEETVIEETSGCKKPAKRSHDISALQKLNANSGNSTINEEDVEAINDLLPKDGSKTMHTEMSYGETQPSPEQAKKINNIANESTDNRKEFRAKVKKAKQKAHIESIINTVLGCTDN